MNTKIVTVGDTAALEQTVAGPFQRAERWIASAVARFLKIQDTAASMKGVHRAFLKDGYIPTGPLTDLRNRSIPFEPGIVAKEYARNLDDVGLTKSADIMRRLGRVVEVGEHEFSVRAVFPEIERIARDETYDPGVLEGITSLPSLRLALNEAIFAQDAADSHALYLEVDMYVLTALTAFDYAYSATTKPGQEPKPEVRLYQWSFEKVPNRHMVCHALPNDKGLYPAYGPIHVVNALSLLYTMAKIGALFGNSGYRVKKEVDDVAENLKKWRAARRKANHEIARMWRLLSGERPVYSVSTAKTASTAEVLSPEELLASIPRRESPEYLRKATR